MFLAAGQDHSVKLFASEDFAFIKSLDGHTANVCCLRFASDDRSLAVGTEDAGVYLWDLTSNTDISEQKHLDMDDLVICLCFNSSRDRLLVQGLFAGITNWDLLSATRLFSVDTTWDSIFCESLFCNGDKYIVGTLTEETKMLTLWDAATGALNKQIETVKDVHGIDLSSDSNIIAVIRGYQSIIIFDMSNEENEPYEITTPANTRYCVCRFLTDSQLVTSGNQNTALWDLNSKSTLFSFALCTTSIMTVHSENRWIGMIKDKSVVIISIDTGDIAWTPDSDTQSLAFSTAVTILM
jgi:WD40 repeat protein